MCIAAFQPPGKRISNKTLRRCWQANNDGAGYMFAVNGKLIIRKPYFKLNDFMQAYRADYAACGDTCPFVLHFRWATHGSKTAGNTHPHVVTEGEIALVHNGILNCPVPKGEDISDTVAFIRKHLEGASADTLLAKDMLDLLDRECGIGNKLILLDRHGRHGIVNEWDGVWDNGIWWSNTGYRKRRTPKWGSALFAGTNTDPDSRAGPWTTMEEDSPGPWRPLEEQWAEHEQWAEIEAEYTANWPCRPLKGA